MDEFERNEINEIPSEETIENPSKETNESPEVEEVHERNTNAPSGWTYSANTNQYVSWDGSSDDNSTQWNPGNPQQEQQPPRKEYGTQYGYYGGPQQSNYYSSNGGYQWDFNKYESADTSFQPKEKKSSKKGLRVFLGIMGALVAVCIISVSSIGIYRMLTGANRISTPEFLEPSPAPSDSEGLAPGISENEVPDITLQDIPKENTVSTDGKLSATEVYKMVSPSVVGIVQYQYSKSMNAAGSGSGIILSDDGYIVTNAHVIDDAEAVKVILYNEEEYEATIVGSDPQTDVAVIKINAKNLVEAEFGDSSQIEIGETVYALGNPGGLALQSSFTDGMISGLNRLVTTDGIYTSSVIQTSAAINPGNSGGALINEYGQVIGITNSKIIKDNYEGIGFAIPTEIAKPVIEEIIKNGYISGRAKLGINGATIDSVTAKYNSVPEGVMITNISAESSFTGTEAKIGDIIIAFDGKEISEMNDLHSVLTKYSPGDEVEITLYRYSATKTEDKTFTVTVKLIENKE